MKNSFFTAAMAACLVLLSGANAALAADRPELNLSPRAVTVVSAPGVSRIKLTIAGPDGFRMKRTSPTGSLTVELGGLTGLPDGSYAYHITGATTERLAMKSSTSLATPGAAPQPQFKGVSASGYFAVQDGTIVVDRNSTEEAAQ